MLRVRAANQCRIGKMQHEQEIGPEPVAVFIAEKSNWEMVTLPPFPIMECRS